MGTSAAMTKKKRLFPWQVFLLMVAFILSMVFLMGASSKQPTNPPATPTVHSNPASNTPLPTPTEAIQSFTEATSETNGIILAGVLLLLIILFGTIGATRIRKK